MARTVPPEAAAALRARLGFLRDMGVYDLYRRDASAVVQEQPKRYEQVTQPEQSKQFEQSVRPVQPVDQLQEKAPVVPASLKPPADTPEPTISSLFPGLLEEPEIPVRKRDLSPPQQLPGLSLPAEARAGALGAIRVEIGDCTRCPLAFEGRHTIVFGDGDPNARLVFVGEGPGADEDAQGIPFIGKSGQLLNNMIVAMGLKRESVYIANIVKCRPPKNRAPEPVEANTCIPFLLQQLGVVRPEVIVALGSTAATYLLGVKSPLGKLRGRIHPAYGAKLIVTYHPAFLLRDPSQKKEAWADLQIAMRELAGTAS